MIPAAKEMLKSFTEDSTVSAPVLKLGTVWAAYGISTWGDAASFLAAAYTTLLIFDWFWRKIWRPFLERKGLITRKKRRKGDADLDEDSKNAPLF